MRRAPPWWPAGEPWPPRHGDHRWRRGRARVMRRVAVAFAVFFVLGTTGAVTIVSWIAAVVRGTPYTVSAGAAAAIGLLVVAVGFVAVMRRVGFPLADVVAAAGRVADGDYGARVEEHGPPSLRSVARAFNRMTAQLQSQDEQRRNLMADVAHELRTPLAVMQGRLEGMLDGVYPTDSGNVNDVLEQARLLSRLVDDLRMLAQAERGTPALHKEPTDLVALAEDTAASFAAQADAKRIAIRVSASDEVPPADADPLRIREALTNLVSNAIRHSRDGAQVTIGVERRGNAVAVSVRDTGEGIPPDVLPRIFDRFYKGPASSGSGLGLTIARNFIAAHGGEIVADSRVGVGTTITFTVPLARS